MVWIRPSRRQFMKQATATGVIALGANSPAFLSRLQAAEEFAKSQDRILVVIQMAGGNDGLNTVVPYANDDYYKARPGIALPKQSLLKLNDETGFHAAMTGMKELFDDGNLSVIQGVGYPNPDRSHFRSMDIWQSAQPTEEYTRDGWLGRAIDYRLASQKQNSTDVPGISVGGEKLPLSLVSTRVSVPQIGSLDEYRLSLSIQKSGTVHEQLLKTATQVSTKNSEQDFVRQAMSTALTTASRIENVANGYHSGVSYPQTGLGNRLKATAQLITADLGAQLFFTSMGGFDTHAQQQNAHRSLLTELSDGVNAFYRDLDEHGLADRALVLTFSEFGRRVQENGSLGTDHGTAGPMFAISKGINTGVVGEHPSLTDLDQGDLKHHTDFRSVYATVLEDWLSIDSEPVLFQKFPKINLFNPA